MSGIIPRVFKAKMSQGNRVAIPAELVKHLRASVGDMLVLSETPYGVLISTTDLIVKEAQDYLRTLGTKGNVVDEFIAERKK